MDQPNCSGSIALEAYVQASWNASVQEIKKGLGERNLIEIYTELRRYEESMGRIKRTLFRLGVLREGAKYVAYRQYLQERNLI